MRYLILGDIHANWEALEAVLADAEGNYDRILCTGDLVGYGAEPAKVVAWARANLAESVRGNHDRVCCGLEDAGWFNPSAQSAILWTRNALDAGALEYLSRLPRGPLTVVGFGLMHGSPLDEDEYLVSPHDLRNALPYLGSALSFAGHTHVQGGFLWPANGDSQIPRTPTNAAEYIFEIPADSFCLCNPGSVGQPRDGDPRAAYLLYGPEDAVVAYRRVAYDIATAQRKILDAGLPARLATRLAAGE